MAEEPALLALSRDRARSSGALAKPKAKPKAVARTVWVSMAMDGAQRRKREKLQQHGKVILWLLVRKALLSIFPPSIVGKIMVAWRP